MLSSPGNNSNQTHGSPVQAQRASPLDQLKAVYAQLIELINQGSATEAWEQSQAMLKLADVALSDPNDNKWVSVYSLAGNAARLFGSLEVALEYSERALNLLLRNEPESHRDRQQLLLDIADVWIARCNWEKAEQSLALARAIGCCSDPDAGINHARQAWWRVLARSIVVDDALGRADDQVTHFELLCAGVIPLAAQTDTGTRDMLLEASHQLAMRGSIEFARRMLELAFPSGDLLTSALQTAPEMALWLHAYIGLQDQNPFSASEAARNLAARLNGELPARASDWLDAEVLAMRTLRLAGTPERALKRLENAVKRSTRDDMSSLPTVNISLRLELAGFCVLEDDSARALSEIEEAKRAVCAALPKRIAKALEGSAHRAKESGIDLHSIIEADPRRTAVPLCQAWASLNQVEVAALLNQRGSVIERTDLSRADSCIESARLALNLVNAPDIEQASLLVQSAKISIKRKDWKQGAERLEQALALMKLDPREPLPLQYFHASVQLGRTLIMAGDAEKGLAKLMSGLALLQRPEMKDTDAELQLMVDAADALTRVNRYNLAQQMALAVEERIASSDKPVQPLAYYALVVQAKVAEAVGDDDMSRDVRERMLLLRTQLDDAGFTFGDNGNAWESGQ